MEALGARCARTSDATGLELPLTTVSASLGDAATVRMVHLEGLESYLVNKAEQRPVRLLGVEVSAAAGPATDWKSLLPTTGAPGSIFERMTSSMAWNKFASGIASDPAVLITQAPAAEDATTSRVGLKEIVAGESTERAFSEAEEALRDAGGARDRRALAVWRFGEAGAGVRVLPSRWSALVLRVEELEAAGASLEGLADVGTSMHALRAGAPRTGRGATGTPLHGQMLVASPHLPGLDLRVTSDVEFQPYWAESDAASNEHVDVALNPPEGSALQKASLSCASVVGRQVLSGWRGRLGFLRNI